MHWHKHSVLSGPERHSDGSVTFLCVSTASSDMWLTLGPWTLLQVTLLVDNGAKLWKKQRVCLFVCLFVESWSLNPLNSQPMYHCKQSTGHWSTRNLRQRYSSFHNTQSLPLREAKGNVGRLNTVPQVRLVSSRWPVWKWDTYVLISIILLFNLSPSNSDDWSNWWIFPAVVLWERTFTIFAFTNVERVNKKLHN